MDALSSSVLCNVADSSLHLSNNTDDGTGNESKGTEKTYLVFAHNHRQYELFVRRHRQSGDKREFRYVANARYIIGNTRDNTELIFLSGWGHRMDRAYGQDVTEYLDIHFPNWWNSSEFAYVYV